MQAYLTNILVAICFATIVYLTIRRPWRYNSKRELPLALFFIYLAVLLSLTLRGSYTMPIDMINTAIYKIKTGVGVNFVPFRYICAYFKYYDFETFFINVTANILIFIPWGFGLPLLWKKYHRAKLLLFWLIGLTVLIEFVQLFISRNFDVDDIILNFLGGAIGAVLYIMLAKIFPKLKTYSK
jgi:glycopeptide antibiotics resistance protein